jgi:hypothetical protein
VTHRDLDLFRALARGPLTVRQVLKLSQTFSAPFPSTRRLQRRLHTLALAGLLRQWWYATEGPGGSAYYTLSPESARLLAGDEEPPARTYSPIGISRQFHTQRLQEFLVHTSAAAHRAGIAFTDFSPENALELEVGEKRLFPDAAFSLIVPGLPVLRYFVEIDTGTEPIHSEKPRDSFQKKLQFYEELRDTGERFRVLGIVTSSPARVDHIIAAAARLARQPGRTVFFGIHLDDYLAQENPLHQPQFRNHRGESIALVPTLSVMRNMGNAVPIS